MNRIRTHLTALVFFLCSGMLAQQATGSEPVEFDGLIEPYKLVNIGSPVEGLVEQVDVERSAVVKQGETMVRLESSVERAAVERARATAVAEGDIKTQEQKLSHAQRTYARVAELFQSEAISAEKRDEAAIEVKLAGSRLQKAREDRTLARLDLERAQAMLNQRTIKSPLSGVVVERYVSPGEFVNNQPLLRVAQLDPLRVELILPAELFRKITPGMKADIRPEAQDSDGAYTATVTIVDRVIDPASGTFGVRLELPNPDYQLPGGLKCKVRFQDEVGAKVTEHAEGNRSSETNAGTSAMKPGQVASQ